MRKSLLIGVVLVVLALGGIGAAFATGMDFPNGVGALSSSDPDVPQVNCDGLRWGVESDYPAALYFVRLSFDRNLNQGTLIAVDITGSGATLLRHAQLEIPSPLLAADLIKIDLSTPVPVEEVYDIRVTVAEPVPSK